jgi:alkanesulfonate monooxygenase SsuD/methylene tetrahydromethanopterin reductase-like flavin-dependent oxidoreductase (luciferase family)
MKFGLAPVQSKPRFEAMIAQAKLAESVGFGTLWAHEHHSEGMMYPDPLMALAVLASATDRIQLGTNMLLLPIHHPVRVAQAAAMLDVHSGGRLRLGVANGYSPTDLQTFAVPPLRRGARLEAGIRLIRELWCGGEVTAEGEDFHLDGFQLFPLPIQKPTPPIVIGGQVKIAIERAARLGDHYLISTTEAFDRVREVSDRYREDLRVLGKPDRGPILNRILCVVDSSAERSRAIEFYAGALLALYDSWGHDNIAQMDGKARSHEAIARSHLIVGEASECIERLHEYAEIGVDEIACLTNFGGPDLALAERSIRLMGERVIPHLA